VAKQSNITKLVRADLTIHITEMYHQKNVNFTHHMLGRNYEIEKSKNILIVRDVGVSGKSLLPKICRDII